MPWRVLIGGRLAAERMFRHIDLPLDQAFDAAQIVAFRRVAERQGHALGAGARGAADAVDVTFGLVRQLEIDDVGHAVHVDAARRNIGRDQDPHIVRLEPFEGPLAGGLRLVAVNSGCFDAGLAELLCDPVRAVLRPREDDDAVECGIGEQVREQRALVAGGHVINVLLYPVGGHRFRRHIDSDRLI